MDGWRAGPGPQCRQGIGPGWAASRPRSSVPAGHRPWMGFLPRFIHCIHCIWTYLSIPSWCFLPDAYTRVARVVAPYLCGWVWCTGLVLLGLLMIKSFGTNATNLVEICWKKELHIAITEEQDKADKLNACCVTDKLSETVEVATIKICVRNGEPGVQNKESYNGF